MLPTHNEGRIKFICILFTVSDNALFPPEEMSTAVSPHLDTAGNCYTGGTLNVLIIKGRVLSLVASDEMGNTTIR
jgi:hypothetical protein